MHKVPGAVARPAVPPAQAEQPGVPAAQGERAAAGRVAAAPPRATRSSNPAFNRAWGTAITRAATAAPARPARVPDVPRSPLG